MERAIAFTSAHKQLVADAWGDDEKFWELVKLNANDRGQKELVPPDVLEARERAPPPELDAGKFAAQCRAIREINGQLAAALPHACNDITCIGRYAQMCVSCSPPTTGRTSRTTPASASR